MRDSILKCLHLNDMLKNAWLSSGNACVSFRKKVPALRKICCTLEIF